MVGAENWGLPGSSRSGLKARKKSTPGFEPAGGEERQDDVAGRARIGGALEHDELAGPQPLGDGPGRVDDVGQVRLARVGQRRRDADDDGVGLVEPAEVDGRLEAALAHLADRRVGDVPDVALAPLEPLDLGRVDVEAQDGDPAVAEGAGQRQADVAQADDPDAHVARTRSASGAIRAGDGEDCGSRRAPSDRREELHGRCPGTWFSPRTNAGPAYRIGAEHRAGPWRVESLHRDYETSRRL